MLAEKAILAGMIDVLHVPVPEQARLDVFFLKFILLGR